MVRRVRVSPADIPVLVSQRGHSHISCFQSDDDRRHYLQFLQEASEKHGLAIHAYCLLDNEAAFLATPATDGSLSAVMQAVSGRYVRHVNRHTGGRGSLFEGRYRSCLVEAGEPALRAQRYLDTASVRRGLAKKPSSWHFCSYRSNALGEANALLQPLSGYRKLARKHVDRLAQYLELARTPLSDSEIQDIEANLTGNLAVGNSAFKKALGEQLGRTLTPGQRGRPRLSEEEKAKRAEARKRAAKKAARKRPKRKKAAAGAVKEEQQGSLF